MKRLIYLLPLFLLAGCNAGSDEEIALGSMAPDAKVETLIQPSSIASLSKQRGKVVLVDFWATWCGPCKAVTPILEKIYAKYHDQGLEGMAITTEAREIVALNEKKRPHEMPVYLDFSEEASRVFGAHSLPTILVIDREGRIAYRSAGAGPNAEADVSAVVEKALGKG